MLRRIIVQDDSYLLPIFDYIDHFPKLTSFGKITHGNIVPEHIRVLEITAAFGYDEVIVHLLATLPVLEHANLTFRSTPSTSPYLPDNLSHPRLRTLELSYAGNPGPIIQLYPREVTFDFPRLHSFYLRNLTFRKSLCILQTHALPKLRNLEITTEWPEAIKDWTYTDMEQFVAGIRSLERLRVTDVAIVERLVALLDESDERCRLLWSVDAPGIDLSLQPKLLQRRIRIS